MSLIAAFLMSGSILAAASGSLGGPYTNWREYLGDASSSHYSALKQINKTNVDQLRAAWTFPTDDNIDYGFNPIIVDGVMYVLARKGSIVALDAETGKEIWCHNVTPPGTRASPFEAGHTRGISYWQSKDGSKRRILFTSRNYLQEISARTGKLITSFGNNGLVDLREGLGRDPKQIRMIESGTPGRVFENLIIEGSSTGEAYGSPPGDIRAYNVLTGKMVWIFHTIPHPGEFGYDTWPKGVWKTAGGANCWGEITVDKKRGIAYVPTGAPVYDFYGADRIGKDLFGDSLLALNARTGKLIWYFQDIHHDLWDYDLTAAPELLTVSQNGKKVDAIAVAGKDGFVYAFNRVTGKPLWPIIERPVPRSHVPGEQAWPTQPFPTLPPPFARQSFTIADINPFLSAKAQESLRAKLLGAVNEGLFTPPEMQRTVEMPGNNGGANFGSTAADPHDGTLFVVSKVAPSILQLKRTPPAMHFRLPGAPAQQGRILYGMNCQMCHGSNLQGQPPSIPSLIGVTKTFNAEAITNLVKSGAGEMPAFTNLSGSQISNIIAFLTNPKSGAPSPGQPSIFTPPAADQKPANGKAPVRYWTGYGYLETKTIPSPMTPPWSTLTAYDLNTGEIKWQIPFGNSPDVSHGLKDLGSIWPKNGIAVTGSGLIFAAPRASGALYAYDEKTGRELWKAELPAASQGVPSVYSVHGREYLVICAASSKGTARGGHASQAPVERSYIAYALPSTSDASAKH